MLKPVSGLALAVFLGIGAIRLGDDVDLAEVDSLVKASAAKFKGPALTELVPKVQARVREQVPAFALDSGWTGSTRAMAARLKTPVPTTPIEFGPIRMVSEKTGHPKIEGWTELFQPRTVA